MVAGGLRDVGGGGGSSLATTESESLTLSLKGLMVCWLRDGLKCAQAGRQAGVLSSMATLLALPEKDFLRNRRPIITIIHLAPLNSDVVEAPERVARRGLCLLDRNLALLVPAARTHAHARTNILVSGT